VGCGKIIHGAAGLVKAATGIDRASDAEVERRRDICRSCPEAVPCVANVGRKCRCRLCGCLLRAKTAIASEQCPAGKW
jgi:hypothetical protein